MAFVVAHVAMKARVMSKLVKIHEIICSHLEWLRIAAARYDQRGAAHGDASVLSANTRSPGRRLFASFTILVRRGYSGDHRVASLICRRGGHRGWGQRFACFRLSWRPVCYSEKWSERCSYGPENSLIRMLRTIARRSDRKPVTVDRKSRRVKGFPPSATHGEGRARPIKRVGWQHGCSRIYAA